MTPEPRRAFLRRVPVTAVGLAAIAGDVHGAARPREPGIGGYPTFQYDYANSGTVPRQRGPKSAPAILWSFADAGPFPIDSPSSLAVADGRVFVGYEQGGFYAFDAADGTTLWHRDDDDDDASFGIPTVTDELVYVPSSDRMYMFDAATGEERATWDWGTEAPVVLPNGETVTTVNADVPGSFSKPAAYADDVLCLANDDANVYAVDTENGILESVRWSYTSDDLDSTSSPPAPTIDWKTVYVGGSTSTGGALVALDISDGTERWRVETDDELNHSVAVDDDVVYVADSGGSVSAFATADGTERWRADAAAEGHLVDGAGTPPAVVDGVVYVGSEDNRIYAFDAADGTELWRFRTNGDIVSLAVVSGVVYAVVGNGTVYALTTPAVAPVPVPDGAATSVARPNGLSFGDIAAGLVTLGGGIFGTRWLYRQYARGGTAATDDASAHSATDAGSGGDDESDSQSAPDSEERPAREASGQFVDGRTGTRDTTER